MIDSRLETCVKHCHIHTVASPIAWAALTICLIISSKFHSFAYPDKQKQASDLPVIFFWSIFLSISVETTWEEFALTVFNRRQAVQIAKARVNIWIYKLTVYSWGQKRYQVAMLWRQLAHNVCCATPLDTMHEFYDWFYDISICSISLSLSLSLSLTI